MLCFLLCWRKMLSSGLSLASLLVLLLLPAVGSQSSNFLGVLEPVNYSFLKKGGGCEHWAERPRARWNGAILLSLYDIEQGFQSDPPLLKRLKQLASTEKGVGGNWGTLDFVPRRDNMMEAELQWPRQLKKPSYNLNCTHLHSIRREGWKYSVTLHRASPS